MPKLYNVWRYYPDRGNAINIAERLHHDEADSMVTRLVRTVMKYNVVDLYVALPVGREPELSDFDAFKAKVAEAKNEPSGDGLTTDG